MKGTALPVTTNVCETYALNGEVINKLSDCKCDGMKYVRLFIRGDRTSDWQIQEKIRLKDIAQTIVEGK